ncbi:MAG: capsule assembly Wzi family protein [Bacteroides sp.]|nr:capsule assembly Wzi family protein [Bacteroides sp.]MCM1379867.1 capsule assembly Wzi family protein [Bacteroides sp.]MCM1446101.1 capsule assembly Wzi family protein [Prevotella sp.]
MIRCKALLFGLLLAAGVSAEDFTMNYSAELQAAGGPGNFTPYYINSLRHGSLTSARGAMLDLKAWRPIDISKRFSYSFGIEAFASATNKVGYDRFNSETQSLEINYQRPAAVVLQQLWGEVKYRGVFLYAGLRDFTPSLLNERLSSGDLIESGNSRNIPQIRAGFIDFQNIPFTNGWVQIQGEVAFAKSTDNGWQKSHFGYYNGHLDLGWWYNYKRCYFRTKPTQPFSITIGLQASAQFNGDIYWYENGKLTDTHLQKFRVRSLLDILLLKSGDGDYYWGNHLGAWDFQARYRLPDRSEIKAYFSWLWEDGSGIGKLNGMDGLWGLEWKPAKPGAISGAVLEVITFMNHGGPIHYAPHDYQNPTLTGSMASGADNYYNNHYANGYALYGMSIGSPMFISPIYNTDGATTIFLNNRFWGLHAAVEGQIAPRISYRAMASYRRFFGTPLVPALQVTHDVSAFFEAKWQLEKVPGLCLGAQVSLDYGNSPYGKNFGALVSASYSGIFNFKTGKSTPCVF